MPWNPGLSGVTIGVLQIVAALMVLAARAHVLPARENWPRVRERDGIRASVIVLVVLTLLLGLMRVTGLDFGLIGEARTIARSENWYASRSLLQYALLGGLALLYCGALLTLRGIQLRGPKASAGLGMAALVALVLVEALRIVSLHAVDALMYLRVGSMTLGVATESVLLLGSLVCLALAVRDRKASAR